MTQLTIHPAVGLRGKVHLPGDKSISHRALLLGALAEGESRIEGFLPSGDCRSTMRCLQHLGVAIDAQDEMTLVVHGCGLRGLQPPSGALNCGRSGTTMRLLSGILSGQTFSTTLTGDPQLRRRPMSRVADPLCQMGARIETTEGHAPLAIQASRLHGIDYVLPVASAQVKSALLLAGLYAHGPTILHEPGPARDHTERMLAAQIEKPRGGQGDAARSKQASPEPLVWESGTIALDPAGIDHLRPLTIHIPGDFSSASFLLVACILVPGSELLIEGIGINPTRTGLLDVLAAMGARFAVEGEGEQGGEPVADLVARTSELQGTRVSGDLVVRMIDEFPILAVAATQASGQTVVHEAQELRVKETDRIATVVQELRKLGAAIEPHVDGFVVSGPTPLRGGTVDSHGDHRLAMALAVAGLIADSEVTVENAECVADSFPGFADMLRSLSEG